MKFDGSASILVWKTGFRLILIYYLKSDTKIRTPKYKTLQFLCLWQSPQAKLWVKLISQYNRRVNLTNLEISRNHNIFGY